VIGGEPVKSMQETIPICKEYQKHRHHKGYYVEYKERIGKKRKKEREKGHPNNEGR